MRDDRMCLCGMFAAEYSTLPPLMQRELRRFFDANEQWLTAVLAQGREARELAFWDSPQERARVFLGALEGTMLVARSYNDDERFRVTAEHLLADFKAPLEKPAQVKRALNRRRLR
jgi:TetR/AcrR family transcriptional repressor of nem operon